MHKYSKEIKEYVYDLHQSGLNYDEIAEEMDDKFGLKFKKVMRSDGRNHGYRYNDLCKIVHEMKGKRDYQINEKQEYKRIASARQRLLLDRKINVKVNNDMHASANKLAFRELILQKLEDLIPEPIKVRNEVKSSFKKLNRFENEVIYIISDEHYRGKEDDETLWSVYDTIDTDIKLFNHKKVHLVYLGDNINGLIHKSNLSSNDGAINSAIKYAKITSICINKLEKNNKLDKLSVYFVTASNHNQTRPLGTQRNELAKEDLGLVISEYLRVTLYPNIHYESDETINTIIDGKTFYMLHGHQGYATRREKLTSWIEATQHLTPDYILLGHFHNFKLNQYGDNKYMITCPAVKNFVEDYELNNGYKLNPSILKLVNVRYNLMVTQLGTSNTLNEKNKKGDL